MNNKLVDDAKLKWNIYISEYINDRKGKAQDSLGGACWDCGESNPDTLYIVSVDCASKKSGPSKYLQVIRDKGRLQHYRLRCANCSLVLRVKRARAKCKFPDSLFSGPVPVTSQELPPPE